MFEFHGWVSISESTCEAEDDENLRASQVSEIRSLCESMSDGASIAEVRLFNGENYLLLHGFRNHAQHWVLELFSSAGAISPGSYGALHIRDDEDPDRFNEVQYFVMSRGKVSSVPEEHFSPCDPKLESYEQ